MALNNNLSIILYLSRDTIISVYLFIPSFICYKFVLLLHVTYIFIVFIGSQLALDNPRLNMLKFIYGHLTPAKIQDLKNACQQEVKNENINM